MNKSRRLFLTNSACSLGAASMLGLGSALHGINALAADTSGYKALVCVFLYGGMDNYDTVIPYDQSSYNRWAQIRSSLIQMQAGSKARTSLLPLSPLNSPDFGSRQFALPPELSGLHNLFESGQAALVGNVGPLIQPLTRVQFEEEAVATPPRLFSHNDQQATWMSSSPEGAQFGWAGSFADAVQRSGSNSFTSITTGNGDLLATGRLTSPYQISPSGAAGIEAYEDAEDAEIRNLMRAHFRAERFQGTNALSRDIAAKMRSSFDDNSFFNSALAGASALTTAFPESELGAQLSSIARTISLRSSLGVNRQIFVVGMGGFDTHSEQATNLPLLHDELDKGVTAFHNAMQELGLGNDVTLFTASDFGRTLAINEDGTDHGWGGHHFVVGGGVSGQRIYGALPESDFGHDLDVGSGRLIPSVSIEQFAAPLGRWFGLDSSEIASSLPNLVNFSSELELFG